MLMKGIGGRDRRPSVVGGGSAVYLYKVVIGVLERKKLTMHVYVSKEKQFNLT